MAKRKRVRGAQASASRRAPAPVPPRPRQRLHWRDELARTAAQIEALRRHESDQVRRAIAGGATWADVAGALGITKQSAHRRFSKAVKGRSEAQSERPVSDP